MSVWINNKPIFECDQYNREMLEFSPWSGHRNFIYDFITYYHPTKVVELGSYYGCSAFAMLQAIKDKKLTTELYAVDTWGGDDFTAHDYEKNIYDAFVEISKKCYKDNLKILRMKFDKAVEKFSDATIDILHIDGSHYYDDVKHDYTTWKNKVKETGIVLFHDISSDKVLGKNMGSHIFWQELKSEYPYTCEFDFSFGLGILFFQKEVYDDFIQKVNMEYYQRLNNELSVNYKDIIRKNHFEIESKKEWINGLKKDKEILLEDNKRLVKEIENIKKIETNHEEINKIKEDYEVTLSEKESYIQELQQIINSYKEHNEEIQHDYEATVSDKEKYIQELQQTVDSYKKQNEEIQHDYEVTVSDKEKYIQELQQTIDSYKKQNEEIQHNYGATVSDKEKYIQELQQTVDSYTKQNEEIQHDYEITISGKDVYIQELQKTIEGYMCHNEKLQRDYEETLAGKEKYINELLQTLDTLNKYEKSTN